MSRKRDVERALAEQQVQARRRSAAHRSLRKRNAQRAVAADAVELAPDEADASTDAALTDAAVTGAGAGAAVAQTADDADAGAAVAQTADDAEAHAGSEVSTDDEQSGEAEAPTDTVIFARVPAFLREPTGDVADDAESETGLGSKDDNSDAELDADEQSEVEVGAGPDTDTDSEAEPGADVDAASDDDATPVAAAAVLAATPESAQESTMVMDPITAYTEPYEQHDDVVLEATEVDEPTQTRTKRRKWPWVLLVVVLVFAAAYYAFATYYGDRVPANTQALGVEIGGLDAASATQTLDVAAAEAESEPLTLAAGGSDTTLIPSDAGLSIDTEAMIDDATGFTLNPITLVAHFTQGTVVDPVVVVDDDAMGTALNTASVQLDTAARDASVTIVGTTASAVPGSPAVTIDHDDTASRIAKEWPANTQIDAVAVVTDADVSDYEADRTVDTLNETVLASAATLTGPNGDVVLEPSAFAPFILTSPSDSRLQISADGAALSAYLLESTPTLENAPVDASLSFDKKHQLVTEPSVPGRALDDDAMGAALVDATMAIDHTGPLAYREVAPAVSSENLGINDYKEIISSFSTPLTNETIRTKNLVRGAEKVTAVTVMPGKDFDLAASLQPITPEGGFFYAHVIENGILVDGIGGGLSQMATTTYNAGYFAGYADVAHQPHSKYFERYPAGRESTIYGRQINMIFTNNTPYAAVMSSYVKNNRLYVDIWSTPYFTVKTEASPWTNVVQPKTVKLDREDCQPNGYGEPGFTITNTRTVFLDGTEVDKNVYKWTYKPGDRIVCI